MTQRCFIIAEAGVNHNGDPELAGRLVDAAAAAGADAVKFQTFTAEKLVRAGTRTAAYQQANAGETDQLAMLRKLEMPLDALRKLAARAAGLGIEFLSTPFDAEAATALAALGMPRMKIPSGELTNLPFLQHVSRTGLPIILSTGMASLAEVEEAVETIARTRRDSGHNQPLGRFLTLLHCTSSYPTAPSDVNLRAMLTLGGRFGLPAGYSDHTDGIAVPVAAVALGAVLIEKHFTLDRSLPGPDHLASLEPGVFAEMVRQIRVVEESLGDGEKAPRAVELPTRDLVRRSAVAAHDLPLGRTLREEDIVFLRPGTGIAPRELPRLLGRRTARAVAAGEILGWGDFEP